MKKLIAMTMVSAVFVGAPAFAASVQNDQENVQSDEGAISKDDAALNKDQNELQQHRADKAAAKANGQYGKQAGKSIAIGADKTKIGEKNAEKKVDQKILSHHQKKLDKDENAAPDTTDTQQ